MAAFKTNMITLAHLSDIHLAPLPNVRARDLLSKRITGYLNWKLKRKGGLAGSTLAPLIAHLATQKPDFTAVTGDLVNLALNTEFAQTALWLKQLGHSTRVAVIPGNHDAYVKGAINEAKRAWGEYMMGETLDGQPFPFVRRVGDVAIVAVSSAITTPPFFAAGQINKAQADRLERILATLGEAELFRVVLIHHPPVSDAARSPIRGLWGGNLFRHAIATHGAELILHGHTHRSTVNSTHGPGGEVPVIGVASASARPGGHDDPARYNLFRIERTGPTWSCTMREYGFQRIGDEIVMRLQMRIH